jgi:eukaryotic-like serine/threonine-protein kinase
LKGEPLEAITQSERRLNLDDVIEYAIQMARGLAAAHARGIVHRDIKPANIWIEESTHRIKILDFGLALASSPTDTMTGRGAVVGTPAYLSPEQAQGEQIDDRCDLYSLGVVIYELICGRVPFVAKTVPELLIKIISHKPPSPDEIVKDLPKPYTELILQLLAKEPRDRVQSAKELEKLLISTHDLVRDQSHAAMQIVTNTPSPSVGKSSPPPIKKETENPGIPLKIWILGTAISATILLAIGSWAILGNRPVASKPMAPVGDKTSSEPVVMAASLEPLRLSDVTGSTIVPAGEQARFKMKLTNTAPDGVRDPRVVNKRAKLVVQVRTFLKRGNEMKRPAPVFPKKMSANQLPAPGQSSDLEVIFSTAGLLAGDYEVSFDLQSPRGGSVTQAIAKFSIGENLQTSDLLGFEILRTSQGRGADTTVKKGAPKILVDGRTYRSSRKR